MALFKDDPIASARKAAARDRAVKDEAESRFWDSPWGRARASFERGDQLFQSTFDVTGVRTDLVPGSNAVQAGYVCPASDVLNAIVAEGWALHSMSTAWVAERRKTEDRDPLSQRRLFVIDSIMGTYVFVRSEGVSAPSSTRAT